MDPYLEAPEVWPDFHDSFLFCVREALQPLLPPRYYAQLRTREEIGVAGYPSDLVFQPDVVVKSLDTRPPLTFGVASSSMQPFTTPDQLVIAAEEPFTVNFLEIRETALGGRLVTLIEILSPSNKLPGHDRKAFEKEQKEVFASDTHWVEIDLLRAGERLGGHPRVDLHCRARGYDYVAVVSRSTKRSPRLTLEAYGFTVQNALPVVAVPLREPDPDVPLDLGCVFRRVYETGPYAKIIRYDMDPTPPLSNLHADWARGVLAAKGFGRAR
ncbi:MAG: DUF4058 family protein [Planctomycetes bacterium]|nr:DUF4058 family protein [Planctomycetota bacterium]